MAIRYVLLVLLTLVTIFVIRPEVAILYEDGSYTISGCLPFAICQEIPYDLP